MTFDLIVNGVAGRMGHLVAARLRGADLGSVAGHDPAAEPPLVLDGTELPLVQDLVTGLVPGGTIVDFSHPAATLDLLAAASRRQARLVVGTTGQSQGQMEALRAAAREAPILVARNFSLGITKIAQVLAHARDLLHHGFDVEILEAHHRGKRDAPSGTATLLLEALLGTGARAPRVHGRHGVEALRRPGEVGVHSVRLGGVPGDHVLLLGSDHEVVEIRHRALSRAAFVSGVVPAVRFIREQPPGLYSMQDVMRHAQRDGD